MYRILGLDIGEARVGIAISDPLKILARELQISKSSELIKDLKEILEEYRVDKVVYGVPFSLKGGESEQSKKIEIVVENLKEHFPKLVFIKQDERFTSKIAKDILIKKGKKGITKSLDALSAAIILKSYLDRLK